MLIKGRNKDDPTQSVLTVMPSKENDGSNYRCTVWNRALGQNQKLETSTEVFVNYFPRITVGPENPLRVEKDETAHLECAVDAKPSVTAVKWIRKGLFVDTSFKRTIPRVGLDDAGSYVCSADNNLGQVGKAELIVDVLYAPMVTLDEQREAKDGENVEIECKVTANPRPAKIEWFKVGDPSFQFSGATLRLNQVTAKDNGRYVCSATNFVQPSGKERSERTGNATIAINIRHQPGKTFIDPEKPVAIDGKSVTLTCGANPPGFPTPTYRWWREDAEDKSLGDDFQLTIDSVKLSSAGKYNCQPTNDVGDGTVGSTVLEVYQAPKVITQLQPTIMKREGDAGFHVSCSAVGRPKPEVKWFKDGRQIMETDANMFQISTSAQESAPMEGYNVQSTLRYAGPERIDSSQLMPSDRGHYSCQFENEVSRAETTMLLRIEHAPVVVHQHNKVAFDLGETAHIGCQMQAFPEPRFDWAFGNSVLQANSHSSNMTALGDDIFESTVKIFSVTESAYGDYTCKALNKIGQKKTIIKLQPKGKPDKPSNIRPVLTSYNAITLAWDEGFNGGYNNTMFTIQYRKQSDSTPLYHDCRHNNPCNISGLEQHTQYYVTVKASNIRGESKFSEEAAVATKIDVAMIPKPDNVHYEKSTGKASFQVDGSSLQLVAKVELENADGTWSHYDGLPMRESTFGEMPVSDPVSNLRVRLCLETNELLCGPYTEALIVDVRPNATTSAALGAPWLIAVVVCIIVLALLALAIAIRCFCCRRPKTLKNEDNGGRPTIIHGTQPPPYTSTFDGIENKGVDSVKDVSDDNIKANLYTANNSYSYHNGHYSAATVADPSNSNSANSGSVNSQDSLWNVKSNGAVETFSNGYQNGYMQYDAMAMQQQQQQQQQGYTGAEDYTHYPYSDEYLTERTRQYGGSNGDPYAVVNKQGRTRLESDYSPYGDVSGLPDPYTHSSSLLNGVDHSQHHQQQHHHHHQMQQQQPHYDESVGESGYSTPTSKNRRIIREIIV